MRRVLPIFLFIAIVFSSCQMVEQPGVFDVDAALEQAIVEASKGQGIEAFMLPESDDFSSIPQDPSNPITSDKVALGQFLFHETKLGNEPINPESMYSYSCASCHHAAGGFQACLQQGLGEGGLGFGLTGEGRTPSANYLDADIDRQPIRTPSALNIAYQENVLWNGQFGGTGMNIGTEAFWESGTPVEKNHLGYHGTETQAIAGLAVHRMSVDSNLLKIKTYKEYFDKVFSEVQIPDRYSRETTGLAIAAYERTLLANQAPFQKWLRGDKNAMTALGKRGALLFFGKAGCVSCHNGPALNDMNFYALGMEDLNGPGVYIPGQNDPANLGRGGFTKRDEDMYKFKVPQLYNLTNSPFFGHGGTFHSVKEVIEYKNNAIPANSSVPASQLSERFVPLELTEQEINQLTYFIENSLNDPALDRYNPKALPSGQCFPNHDDDSRRDLGCK